jgi:hypothetical protein
MTDGTSVADGRGRARESVSPLALGMTLTSLVLQTLVLIASQAHLFADGAFYLNSLLTTESPLPRNPGRHFANLATEWPAVAGIRLGVADLDQVSYLLGMGLYMPTFVGLVCCAWIARRTREWLLFPLLTAVAVTSNSAFFVVSESHVLVGLFWPLLFLLLLDRRWSWRAVAAAIVLALPTLRCYESMVFFGPLLAAAAGWRATRAASRRHAVGFVALALYFLGGTVIAARGILSPREPQNYTQFRDSFLFFRDHLGHWHWLALASMAVVVAVGFTLAFRVEHRGWLLLMLITIGAGSAVAALVPLLDPMTVAPLLQVRARVLNAYIPPLLALLLLLVLRRPPPTAAWRFAFNIVAVLAIAQLTGQLLAVREWSHYRRVFRQEVATRLGLVPFQASRLSSASVDGRPIAAMNWDWTMPTASIFLAPKRGVRALIDNPPSSYWKPFCPADPAQLPDLARYGVRFDEYLAALRSSGPAPQEHDRAGVCGARDAAAAGRR